MFFIKFGKFAAYSLFALSLIPILFGFLGAFYVEEPAAFARLFFNEPNTGAMIDEGLVYLGISLVLGILSEIGAAIVKLNESR